MRKKIKVSVKQILGRQHQNNKHKCNKQVVLKGQTFEELYNLIVKNRKICDSSSASSTYLNSKKCTPQNTGRNNINVLRINHSLQKICDKKSPVRQRSLSAPKKRTKSFIYQQQIPAKNILDSNFGLQDQFQAVRKQLNHNNHQHIRQKQCFLSQEQLIKILSAMSYIDEYSMKLVKKLYKQLGGVTYGGVPSENLKQFLIVLNGQKANKRQRDKIIISESQIESKFIDFNLKFKATETQKKYIYTSYTKFRDNRKNKKSELKITKNSEKQNKESSKNILSKVKQKEHKENIKIENQTPQKIVDQNLVTKKTQVYQDSFENLFLKEKGILKDINRSNNRKPILSVDVNLGEGNIQKVIVYEGQTPSNVADRLADKFPIDQTMKSKFQKMLQSHIRCLLWKIEEVSEQLFSDRQ